MSEFLDASPAGPEEALVLPPPPADGTITARVVHVINGEHFSGAERVQDLLAENLPRFGYQIGLAAVKPGRFRSARSCRSAPLVDLPMKSRLDFSCGRRLARLVAAERYDVLHAHTPRSLMAASQAATATGVPLIYHVHSPAGRDSTRWLANRVNLWLERRWARRAVQLIAVSPSVRQYMINQGLPAQRVVYVPNGVPSIDAQPRAYVPSIWTLGMAALFRPRKGIETLLQALAAARATGADVRLRAIGPFETASYESEIRQLVTSLQLDEAVTWTGFVHDIAAELAKIDVSVLPSLFGEGLPMVVLESMSAGVPVIASRVEGIPEAIRHGKEGLLVQPGSVGELTAAINQLVEGSCDYTTLSRRAQARHRKQFSATAMARKVANLYDAILGS